MKPDNRKITWVFWTLFVAQASAAVRLSVHLIPPLSSLGGMICMHVFAASYYVTPSHLYSPWSSFLDSYCIYDIIQSVYVCNSCFSLPAFSSCCTLTVPCSFPVSDSKVAQLVVYSVLAKTKLIMLEMCGSVWKIRWRGEQASELFELEDLSWPALVQILCCVEGFILGSKEFVWDRQIISDKLRWQLDLWLIYGTENQFTIISWSET